VALRVVRLGSARSKGEGLRLGTVRRPPRGVKKADYARLDYYDLWLPDLAPSAPLVARALKGWKGFEKAYRREMKVPAAARLIELLARLSHHADFSVGCYCADEQRCHRGILRALLAESGATIKREKQG
jgi:uncharacterized protein YeaO (DUF488 family)